MHWLSEYFNSINWLLTLTSFGTLVGAWLTMLKIYEWATSRPKVKGEILQVAAVVRWLEDDEEKAVSFTRLLMQVYVVNVRPHPTTIKKWQLTIEHDLKEYTATIMPIPVTGSMFDENIIFQELKALDTFTYRNVLEYNKGIDGWLRFEVRDIELPAFKKDKKRIAILNLTAIDSRGKKHKLNSYQYEGAMFVDYNVGLASQ